ncbi:sugar phosphate nucleotidyltransferase [Plantactinospora sp. GCM10030261]|uniref:sugar phosphate nucleotidyltransferase n=1 Tax=Plantactinospora sp. GCM10030261 TaxID=3273420 RepID=UPI00361ABAB2
MHAIVLVGGKATRLWPRTRWQPKALVKIGHYSILEIIIRRLRDCGFDRITLCIAHLGDMIKDEFGDGRHLGVAVDYCAEERPLGTAAPLHLVPDWTSPAVVMNGDILTTIDFADLHRQHTTSGNLLTVAFHKSLLHAGVGVLRVRDGRVQQIWEKPNVEWNINAGIYVADPRVRDHIPRSDAADMPGLINALLADGQQVTGYGFSGQWYDIGTPFRYQKAMKEFLTHPDRYLRPDAPSNGNGRRNEVALEPDGDRLSVADLSPWS